jgi:small nuclear ribonucleoprotein (snRNP)-like protein
MNTPDFFNKVLGRLVLVKLTSGHSAKGYLEALDGNLNVVLRQEGKIIFIRGNNVYFLTPDTEAPE